MHIFLVFIAGILGGLLPYFWKEKNEFFKIALPFSGAFLMSISFLHLIPDTLEDIGHHAGFYILLGFILQLILQRYSHGIEHGHESHHHLIPNHMTNAIFWGLGLHAIIEGVPLAYHFRNIASTENVTLGIIVHKIPEAFTFAVFLMQSTVRKQLRIAYIIGFALFTPLSAIVFQYLGQQYYFISHLLPFLVALAIGSFILISTTIFFESEGNKHNLSKTKLISLLSGFLIALSIELFSNH